MMCPECNSVLRKVGVKVKGAKSKAVSYQCTNCAYFEFEQGSSQRVLAELRDSPLKIKQSIVKLSQDRLGIYFNSHVVRSLRLKKGESVYVSVPDENHIVLELAN